MRDRLVGTGSPGLAILARMEFTSEVLKGRGVSPWAPTERISGGVIAPWTGRPRRSLAANQSWNQWHPLKEKIGKVRGRMRRLLPPLLEVKGVPEVSDPFRGIELEAGGPLQIHPARPGVEGNEDAPNNVHQGGLVRVCEQLQPLDLADQNGRLLPKRGGGLQGVSASAAH